MKFLHDISDVHSIFLFISFQLYMDLMLLSLCHILMCFEVGHQVVFFGSSSVIDMVIIFFQKVILKDLWQVLIDQIQIGNCCKLSNL